MQEISVGGYMAECDLVTAVWLCKIDKIIILYKSDAGGDL